MTLAYHQPLTGTALLNTGVPAPFVMGLADRVRYAELDPLDHANNTAYFRWFEAVRILYVRDLGLSHYRHGIDPRLVIRSTSCTFLREMRQDQDFVVACRTRAYRQSSFTMEYAVFAPEKTAEGEAVVVMQTPDGQGKYPLPADVVTTMSKRDGAARET